jgi:succinate dehydrogenase hydrophobic anchor subunit
MPKRPRRILRRRWATAEGWRGTRAGMWAWLVQRGAAVVLLLVIVLHVRTPYWRAGQALLLALVLVHGLLGVRAILLDFGLPVRWHRLALVGAGALAVVIFGAVWGWRWS